MDDARRFLRYVLPGVFFALETSVLLFLLRPDLLSALLATLSKESALGAALLALFATGGLGFLFSVVHHAIHWRASGKTIDHRSNLERLRRDQVLELPSAQSLTLTREDAWVITSTLWYTRRKTSQIVEGADENARMLVDLSHMLGTARVAAAVAPMVALLAAAALSQPSTASGPALRFVLALAISIGLGRVFWTSYLRTTRFAQKVIDQVLADALHAEKEELGHAVRTHLLLAERASNDAAKPPANPTAPAAAP